MDLGDVDTGPGTHCEETRLGSQQWVEPLVAGCPCVDMEVAGLDFDLDLTGHSIQSVGVVEVEAHYPHEGRN